jgi:hypothetical protein
VSAPDHAGWEQVLSTLEHELDVLAESVATQTVTVPVPFQAPQGLGPLPPALRDRAMALWARMHDVEATTTEAVHRTRRDVAVARTLAPDAPAPRFLDVSA